MISKPQPRAKMTLRARFFDDYRLSRIDEEADRLSLQSEISCGVDVGASSSKFMAQRSASADGTLQATSDDDDDDDYELPLPPPYMTIGLTKPKAMDGSALTMPSEGGQTGRGGSSDEELSMAAKRALNFMQAKYDSLGKVKVEKPLMSNQVTSPTTHNDVNASLAAACELRPRLSTLSDAIDMVPPMSTLCRSIRHRDAINGNSVSAPTSGPEICFNVRTGSVGNANMSTSVSRNPLTCSQPRDDHEASTTCNHCGNGNNVGSDSTPAVPQWIRTCAIRSPTDPAGTGPLLFRNQTTCGGDRHEHVAEEHRRLQVEHQNQHQPGVQSPTSSSNGSIPTARLQSFVLTAAELFQVDLFYRSFKTIVHVSTCGATLYSGTASRQQLPHHGHRQSRIHNSNDSTTSLTAYDWKPVASGIPVVLLDQRFQPGRLCVVLAERGTAFELWRQAIDRTDQYAVFNVNDEPVFHVVSCSDGDTKACNGGRRMGLQFNDAFAANEYRRQLLKLADFEQQRSSGGGRSGKKKIRKGGKGKRTPFSKADISQPCCFTHVTRLEKDNGSNTLLDKKSGSSRRK